MTVYELQQYPRESQNISHNWAYISTPARIQPVEWVKSPFLVVGSLAILSSSEFSFSVPDSLRITARLFLTSSRENPFKWSFVPGAHFYDVAIRQGFNDPGTVGVVCSVLYQSLSQKPGVENEFHSDPEGAVAQLHVLCPELSQITRNWVHGWAPG